MTSPSATQDSYPYQNEPIWSRSEKVIARTAFDAALGRELHEVIQEAKRMASRKYDYRYSQLTHVFGRLLYEMRLCEDELRGLGEDKLKPIRSFAKFLAEDAA